MQFFEPLYNKYHEQIFRYVYQRVDGKDIAHDITSQVFLKAMKNLNKYQFKGVPFSSWLYRIATSEIYQSYKDKKAERIVNFETEKVIDIIDEIEEDSDDNLIEKIINEIAKLQDDELQMIELRFFEKRAYKEISEIMSISESNAKVKIHRIIKKLKTLI